MNRKNCWEHFKCGRQTGGENTGKLGDCLKCEFYASVRQEQGGSLVTTKEILEKLNGNES